MCARLHIMYLIARSAWYVALVLTSTDEGQLGDLGLLLAEAYSFTEKSRCRSSSIRVYVTHGVLVAQRSVATALWQRGGTVD